MIDWIAGAFSKIPGTTLPASVTRLDPCISTLATYFKQL
jgi:hypothetical protein